jgi:hypothetical protein
VGGKLKVTRVNLFGIFWGDGADLNLLAAQAIGETDIYYSSAASYQLAGQAYLIESHEELSRIEYILPIK